MYSKYDKTLLVGDFSTKVSDTVSSNFLYQHDFENLAKDNICFKNANNLSAIDLSFWPFLTFQNTTTTFTALSEWRKLILKTVLKTTFSKNKPKEFFTEFIKNSFFFDFDDELKTIFSRNTAGTCHQFFLNVLDKHAPLKRKLLRAKHSSYTFSYKQLGLFFLGFLIIRNPQSYLNFQSFWGSKFVNVCQVVWTGNLCLRGMQ